MRAWMSVAVVAVLAGCSDNVGPMAPRGVDAGGDVDAAVGGGIDAATTTLRWTGRWGSGRYGLSFLTDDAGRLSDFTLTDYVSSPCGNSSPYENVYTGPVAMNDAGEITFTSSATLPNGPGCGPDGSCLNIDFHGKAAGPGRMEGTFSETFFNRFTACFGFGSGVRWTAAPDCTLAPQLGASATRFCAN